MNLVLTVQEGYTRGAAWKIESTPLLIGRDRLCDIVIKDGSVSRRHCSIRRDGACVLVEDLGSRNAVICAGRVTRKALVHVGEDIVVGSVVFVVASTDIVPLPAKDADSKLETRTIAMAKIQAQLDPEESDEPETPALRREDLKLFQRLRKLSQCNSVAELLSESAQQMKLSLGLDRTAFYRLENQEWVHLGGERWPEQDLAHLAMGAIKSEELVVESQITNGIARSQLAVPLLCGPDHVGVYVGEWTSDTSPPPDESLLFVAAALCDAIGPLLNGLARADALKALNTRLACRTERDHGIVGESRGVRALRNELAEAARTNLNVIICGETGTGKELVARAIHRLSSRAGQPYIVANCGSIGDGLFESEFFGHRRGAFTGANHDRQGLIRMANGGMLFLDELGDLSIRGQSSLLRVVEYGAYRAVGDDEEAFADVIYISATNKPIDSDGFRNDLFHRLGGVVIHVPALRDRLDDIPLLAQHFLDGLGGRNSRMIRTLSDRANEQLMTYNWPGNVRELRAVVERAAHRSHREILEPEDVLRALPNSSDVTLTAPTFLLADVERNHIAKVVGICEGNIAKSAKMLGMCRSTLYQKVAQYGIK